jgi:uncharacterized protein (DUF1684 family)
MSAPADAFTLAHWRRSVAELYALVRVEANADPAAAAREFRAAREALFREHADSPIAPEQRATWPGLAWYPYDPAWRVDASVDRNVEPSDFEISLAADGILRCVCAGIARFVVGSTPAALPVYWLGGYGGGLWLPFGDATNGRGTYSGGRYLYDTIKGADLGGGADSLVLDFNFAYNPSCAYDERWSCPLAPPANRLPFAVNAGERSPGAVRSTAQ